jgi:hypothetical protein
MSKTSFPVLFRFIVLILFLVSAGSSPNNTGTVIAASDGYQVFLPQIIKPATVNLYQYAYSATDILNPERGFRSSINLMNTVDLSPQRNTKGHTLVFAYLRLDDYRTSDLPADFLSSLDAAFARIRQAGIKVIVRVAYNAGFEADTTKDWMLRHITQLTPMLQKNADVIAWMQAGFIGAWGEWHSSTNGLDNAIDKQDILDALLNALPNDRIVQVRSVKDIEALYPSSLAAGQAFTGTFQARTGHHNDCFLASNTDSGTYGSNTIPADKDYLSQMAQFTPIGGETCTVNPPRSECASALQEMAQLHYTELNAEYNGDVITGWKTGGCYAEISQRLGYRLAIVNASFEATLAPGDTLNLQINLQNKGFAAPVNPRPVVAVLDGPARYEFPLTADPRRWEPGDSAFSAQMSLPAGIPAGTYRIALWLPDASPSLRSDPRYAIRFANENIWEGATGFNSLGTVVIKK